MLDQIEQRRLAPVDVLEHDDERGLPCENLEETSHRPEHLFLDGAGLPDADRGLQACGHHLRISASLEQLQDPPLARRVLDDLAYGPVRDPLAIRKAAADEDARILPDSAGKLLRQPRLPDTCLAEDGEQLGPPLASGPLEGLAQLGQLALAADERRVEVSLVGRSAGHELDETPGRENVRLAVTGGEVERLEPYRVADETARGLADHDSAALTRLLEVGGRIERIAGDDRIPGRRVAGQHLSGVDADTQQLTGSERRPQLCGRPHRTQRVILVGCGDPEDADHPIVARSLDRGAVRPEHGSDHVEGAIAEPASELGIDAPRTRLVCELGDENGDGLSCDSRRAALGHVLCRCFRQRAWRRGQLQLGVLAQDGLMEFTQLAARLDAELLHEQPARRLVRGERVGLAARAVEGDHQLAPESLAKRMRRRERLELADDLGVAP